MLSYNHKVKGNTQKTPGRHKMGNNYRNKINSMKIKNQMNNMISKNKIIKMNSLNHKIIQIDNKNQMNNNNRRMQIKMSNNNRLMKIPNLMIMMIKIDLINSMVRIRINPIIQV